MGKRVSDVIVAWVKRVSDVIVAWVKRVSDVIVAWVKRVSDAIGLVTSYYIRLYYDMKEGSNKIKREFYYDIKEDSTTI